MKKKLAMLLVLLLAVSWVGALAEYGAILNKTVKVYSDSARRVAVGKLPKYTAVVVKSVKNGRAKLSYAGKTLYVSSKYLSRPYRDLVKKRIRQGDNTEDLLRYVKKTCYVYDYPSKTAHKLKKVKKGTVLPGFKEKKGWSIVLDKKEKYYGYIKTSNLDGMSGGDGSRYSLK